MGFLLQFLYESNLIEAERPDITLGGANLGDANLLQANLEGANLVRANLTEADLERATLLKANLTEAELQARAQVVHEELKAVEARREELAEELREVLQEHARLHGAYTEAVCQYSQDQANSLASSRPDMYSRWFKKRFAKWF